jgi:outer membrane protein assembly factor BamB
LIVAAGAVVGVALWGGADWRQFRGPDARGVAASESLPVAWNDGKNGDRENIAWKIELPGRGPSSPIVVAGRVVVTCSSGVHQDRLHVLCVDAATGARLWHRQFWATGRTLCHPTSANAAPTPSSDGQRIFAFYSSNDLICLDLQGNLNWYRGLAFDYPHAGNDAGMASSPLVIGKTVVVQVENQGDSFAAGIDVETGRNRWRMARKRDASWASPAPLLGPALGRSLVLLQSPSGLTAVDPVTGVAAWQFDATCEGIPSPVAADGVVYVPADGITALRPPREPGQSEPRVLFQQKREPGQSKPRDLCQQKREPGQAKPKVLWQQNRLKPGPASPIIYQGDIYIVNSSGVISCGAAATGKLKWRLRLKGRSWATPVAVGKRLYVINSDGLAQVVELGRKGRVVGTSDFGEIIQASPAVVDDAMFVRSDRHLWKIAADKEIK